MDILATISACVRRLAPGCWIIGGCLKKGLFRLRAAVKDDQSAAHVLHSGLVQHNALHHIDTSLPAALFDSLVCQARQVRLLPLRASSELEQAVVDTFHIHLKFAETRALCTIDDTHDLQSFVINRTYRMHPCSRLQGQVNFRFRLAERTDRTAAQILRPRAAGRKENPARNHIPFRPEGLVVRMSRYLRR